MASKSKIALWFDTGDYDYRIEVPADYTALELAKLIANETNKYYDEDKAVLDRVEIDEN